MDTLKKAMYVILLGPPGAGKGTQAVLISEACRLAHIASGDLIRQVRESDTELGRLVKSYYDKGELAPDELTIRMVLERLDAPESRGGVLLDGFPRTVKQAEALDAALVKRGTGVHKAVSIDVSKVELLRRLAGRWLCRACGRSYHVVSAPPKQSGVCDACGGPLYQRPDDSEETAKNRLKVYFKQTLPLVEYYRNQGKLVQVNGEGSVEHVTHAIEKALATEAAA